MKYYTKMTHRLYTLLLFGLTVFPLLGENPQFVDLATHQKALSDLSQSHTKNLLLVSSAFAVVTGFLYWRLRKIENTQKETERILFGSVGKPWVLREFADKSKVKLNNDGCISVLREVVCNLCTAQEQRRGTNGSFGVYVSTPLNRSFVSIDSLPANAVVPPPYSVKNGIVIDNRQQSIDEEAQDICKLESRVVQRVWAGKYNQFEGWKHNQKRPKSSKLSKPSSMSSLSNDVVIQDSDSDDESSVLGALDEVVSMPVTTAPRKSNPLLNLDL